MLAVGEVLWDRLPGGKQLGGAPANFAFHARALGAEAGLVSRVGVDPLGREVRSRFETLGVPGGLLQDDPDRPTGTVDVALGADGQPRYTIAEGVAWDRIAAAPEALAAARGADAVVFGSLARRSEPSRSAIRAIVEAAPAGALRLFDVNLRPPFVSEAVIADSLAMADALKLNDDELAALAAMFALPTEPHAFMRLIADRFALRAVALTRGAAGSVLRVDGAVSELEGLSVSVADTIGAGDSFAAALVVGLLRGVPLDPLHRHARAVSSFVCTRPGGTPTLPDSLRRPS